jgi:delta1-piperideine-2-carboxylate reductase
MNTNEQSAEIRKITPRELLSHVTSYLVEAGCSKEAAGAVSGVIVAAEADGCKSHGVFRLPGYVASLKSGKVNGHPNPTFSRVSSGLASIDGDRGFAPAALACFREKFAELAKAEGIAALAIKNVYHFSALWTDIEYFCDSGLVAFAFTSYLPSVAPAGGKKALYGTNPMAFGWPRKAGSPMIFDQASSVVARGDIMIAAREGHELLPGTGLDVDGNPTNDPAEVLKGAMLPFGGYKGASIALMVELLAGPLIGENLSFEAYEEDNKDGGPPRGGELIIAISPERLNAHAGEHGERIFRKLEREESVRVPSSRRYTNRKLSHEHGIPINGELISKLNVREASLL